jgi:hypothetical protein
MRGEVTGDSRKLDKVKFIVCNPCQILLGDAIKEDELERACDSHEGDDEYLKGLVGNLKKKTWKT